MDFVCCILAPNVSEEIRCSTSFTRLFKVLARLGIPVIIDEPWAFQNVNALACALRVRA